MRQMKLGMRRIFHFQPRKSGTKH